MNTVFGHAGFEAITVSSLSEKVLRSTLPDTLYIHRPDALLRSTLLRTNGGARIEYEESAEYYPTIWEKDLNKAYLYIASRGVPSPYVQVMWHFKPHSSWVDRYPVGYWHVKMRAKYQEISPILLGNNGEKKRKPGDGELLDIHVWTGELEDCLEAGYELLEVLDGYGWTEMSTFMTGWAELLWSYYLQCRDSDQMVRDILKAMMVSMPGRFLKQPYRYTLVSGEPRKGDVPIAANWTTEGGNFFSGYYCRPEYDLESTALTPQGAYISIFDGKGESLRTTL